MAATLCQVLGFVLSLLGVGLVIAATAMDQWATEDLYGDILTSVYTYSGLWNSCVRRSTGLTECRPYLTILGLPALLQAVRALMIISLILGGIALLISIFALKCLKIGNMEDKIKAIMTLTAGIMQILAGICAIAGVSAFANLIVQSFFLTSYTDIGIGVGSVGSLTGTLAPRYTFGPALFVGWIGGGILVFAGVMMSLACRGMAPDRNDKYDGIAYKASSHHTQMYRQDPRPLPEDVSYKDHSTEGRPSSQRINYV